MGHHGGILEKGIEVSSINCCRDKSSERVRSGEHEEEKTDTDDSHHTQHARHHFIRKMLVEK